MKLPIACVFTVVFYGYVLTVFDANGVPFIRGLGILVALAGASSAILAVIEHLPRAVRRRYERVLTRAFSLKPIFGRISLCVSLVVVGQLFAFLITPVLACFVLVFLVVVLGVVYIHEDPAQLGELGVLACLFGIAAVLLSVLHDPITTHLLNAVGKPALVASSMLDELPVIGWLAQPLSPEAFRARFFVVIDWVDFTAAYDRPRHSWFDHYYHYMLTHLSPQAILFRSSRSSGVLVYAAIQVAWWVSVLFAVSLIPRLFLGTPFLYAIALKRYLGLRGSRVAIAASLLTWMCVPSALWYLISR